MNQSATGCRSRKLALRTPITEAKKAMMFLLRTVAVVIFPLLSASCTTGSLERRSAIVPNSAIAKAHAYGLVDVRSAVPDISVDLRYATKHNVTQRPIYPRNMPCLLRASTLARVQQAQATLRAQGYGLRIWDAWRPPEAQNLLYQHGGKTGMFLAPSVGWSRHCGGISLDATLVDLHGNEQRLPTYFDENLHAASSNLLPSDPLIRHNLVTLHQAMEAAGLKPLAGEWWHFDDIDFLYGSVPVITAAALGIQMQ